LLIQQHCQQYRLSRVSGVLNESRIGKDIKTLAAYFQYYLGMGRKNNGVVLTWCLSWVSNPYIRVRSNLLLSSSRGSGGGGGGGVVVTRPRKMRRMRILH